MPADWIEFDCDGMTYVLYVRAQGRLDLSPSGVPVFQGHIPYVWAVDVAGRIVEVCAVDDNGHDPAQIPALVARACARIREPSPPP
jgi:hypothetical protein